MTVAIATTEPESFVEGDAVTWTKDLPDYLPADSWVLSYALTIAGIQITFSASDNGDGTHLVALASATTAAYTPGEYSWQAYVTKAGARTTVGSGSMTIAIDLAAQVSGYDDRSDVKQTLDALETLIKGKAVKDVDSYSVGSGTTQQSLSKLSPSELISWYKYYKKLYNREQRALGRSGYSRTRYGRFNR